MARTDFIEQLVQQASKLAAGGELQRDLEAKLRVLMQGAFNRMDLVSRDEFDAQAAVLARTRAKLEALEQQLTSLQAEVENR